MQQSTAAAAMPSAEESAARDVAEIRSSRLSQVRASGEEGAQAVEYAMIAGVGASVIGLIWSFISKGDVLGKLLRVLLDALLGLIQSWF